LKKTITKTSVLWW